MDLSSSFLTTMADHLTVGLVIIDSDDKIVLFNRVAGIMLHEEPAERLGSTIFSCHPVESDGAVAKLIQDIRTGAIDHYEGWVNYRGRMLYEQIRPIRTAQGEYLGMIEELHDAEDRAELLRLRGEWKDVHVSGVGSRAPRAPEFERP
ncbi:MAG TPA: PAS domain-containing protein [Anaerolineales bacterium]|nr:PAS domain-containing protein [Anaerolineales bacterium]